MGVCVLQLMMTQVVTFLVSLLYGGMPATVETQPILFCILVGMTFFTGIFLTGWLALKWHWLKSSPRLPSRLVGTLAGVFLPLLAGLILKAIETGSPFFGLSTVFGILGFHLPGWIGGKQ
jgi:hypothetical protein